MNFLQPFVNLSNSLHAYVCLCLGYRPRSGGKRSSSLSACQPPEAVFHQCHRSDQNRGATGQRGKCDGFGQNSRRCHGCWMQCKSDIAVKSLTVILCHLKGERPLLSDRWSLGWCSGPSEIQINIVCHRSGCRRQQPSIHPTNLQCQPTREQPQRYSHITVKGEWVDWWISLKSYDVQYKCSGKIPDSRAWPLNCLS